MVSIFIATSDLHIRHKNHKPKERVLDEALLMIDLARDHGIDIRFAAEDASRTDMDFLLRVYLGGAEHGANLLSFADTVGCLVPMQMFRIMSQSVCD